MDTQPQLFKPDRESPDVRKLLLILKSQGDWLTRKAISERTGWSDREIRMLAEAEKRTPTSGRVLRSLATLHAAAGRAEQARGCYARLVELLPDAPDIDELRNTLRVLGETKGGAR